MTPIISSALVGLFLWNPVAVSTVEAAIPEPVLPTYTVAMTGYNAVSGQTDEDPFTTASGLYSNPDIIAARSVDLADELPFGTVIEITTASSTPGCGLSLVDHQVGVRVIGDSMNARMRNKIDLLFDQNDTVRVGGKLMNPARVLGICKSVEIRVIGKIDLKNVPKSQDELRLAVGYLPQAKEQALAIKK